MPSAAQIARERERVRRAFAWWQRKLDWSYDIKITAGRLPSAEMQVSARAWPYDPKAFDIEFDVETVQELSTQELRENALHELGHILLWPATEDATKGMSDEERSAWVDRVEEPVVNEWARVVSRFALGKWSQR